MSAGDDSSATTPETGGRPSVLVMCRMMSVSKPFSLVSVVIQKRTPHQRVRDRCSSRYRPRWCRSACSGSCAAASRTSSLPVTASDDRAGYDIREEDRFRARLRMIIGIFTRQAYPSSTMTDMDLFTEQWQRHETDLTSSKLTLVWFHHIFESLKILFSNF